MWGVAPGRLSLVWLWRGLHTQVGRCLGSTRNKVADLVRCDVELVYNEAVLSRRRRSGIHIRVAFIFARPPEDKQRPHHHYHCHFHHHHHHHHHIAHRTHFSPGRSSPVDGKIVHVIMDALDTVAFTRHTTPPTPPPYDPSSLPVPSPPLPLPLLMPLAALEELVDSYVRSKSPSSNPGKKVVSGTKSCVRFNAVASPLRHLWYRHAYTLLVLAQKKNRGALAPRV